jgi:hypothetical protein
MRAISVCAAIGGVLSDAACATLRGTTTQAITNAAVVAFRTPSMCVALLSASMHWR